MQISPNCQSVRKDCRILDAQILRARQKKTISWDGV
jgi:hypothetical protein